MWLEVSARKVSVCGEGTGSDGHCHRVLTRGRGCTVVLVRAASCHASPKGPRWLAAAEQLWTLCGAECPSLRSLPKQVILLAIFALMALAAIAVWAILRCR